MVGDVQIMKAIERAVSKMVQGFIIIDEFGWPPVCSGTFYQPERPVADIADNSSESTSEETIR